VRFPSHIFGNLGREVYLGCRAGPSRASPECRRRPRPGWGRGLLRPSCPAHHHVRGAVSDRGLPSS